MESGIHYSLLLRWMRALLKCNQSAGGTEMRTVSDGAPVGTLEDL